VVVAEGVVDLLEAVQVQQQQRGGQPLPAGEMHRLLGAVPEKGTVGQPGELIGERLVGQRAFQLLALAHVA
jgi:hypothetical protein